MNKNNDLLSCSSSSSSSSSSSDDDDNMIFQEPRLIIKNDESTHENKINNKNNKNNNKKLLAIKIHEKKNTKSNNNLINNTITTNTSSDKNNENNQTKEQNKISSLSLNKQKQKNRSNTILSKNKRTNEKKLLTKKSNKTHNIQYNSNNNNHEVIKRKRKITMRKLNHSNTNSNTCMKFLWFIGFIILVSVITFSIYKNKLFFFNNKPSYFQLKLFNHFPVQNCLELSKQEILNLKQKDEWKDIRLSMNYYVDVEEFDGISAFNIGKPYCFMLIKQDNNKTLGLFNVQIIGYSPDNIVTREEYSASCSDEAHYVDRATKIWIEYTEEDTMDKMVRRFNGTESYTIQNLYLYSQSKSICDGTDLGIKSLHP